MCDQCYDQQNLVTQSRNAEILTKSKFKCLLTSESFAVYYPDGLSVLFAGTSDRKSVQNFFYPEPEVAKRGNFQTGKKQNALRPTQRCRDAEESNMRVKRCKKTVLNLPYKNPSPFVTLASGVILQREGVHG
jgi:hypothetical protein